MQREKGAKEIKQSSVQPIFFLKKSKGKKKADFVLWEARLPLLLLPPAGEVLPEVHALPGSLGNCSSPSSSHAAFPFR